MVLIGTVETDNELHDQLGGYENVTVTQHLSKPTLEFLRYIDKIQPTPQNGDWIDGLVVASQMIDKHCGKKKYNKRIFLITDGQSKVGNPSDLKQIAESLKAAEIKLNVIALDFCNELQFEKEEEKLKAAESESPVQQGNKRLLLELTIEIDGRIFPAKVAMEIYHQFRKRNIHPVAKYRGSLEISKDLNIQVLAYTKTRAETLPNLTKHSLVAPESTKADSGKVKVDRTYHLLDDPEQKPIDIEQKIKAYQYGAQLVPVSQLDEKLLINEEEKCLKLLGFAKTESIPRHHYMSGVDILLSIPEKPHSEALASLIRGLHESNKVMICRFMAKNNTVPHIAVLSPHISKRLQCLYINYLPTIEDLRDYQFTSPVKSTEEQQKAASDFIDSLDLTGGGEEEQLKPKMTFNPVLQYMYQCIQNRALNPEDNKLPDLDENIASYIKPDKKLFESAEIAVNTFSKSFDLHKVESLQPKPKRVYWRDLISQEEDKEVKASPEEEQKQMEEVNPVQAEKGKGVFEPEEVKEISVVDPITDFKKMIGDRHRDRVDEALCQMKNMIIRFIDESLVGSSYDRALECLIAMREACVKEDEAVEFNDFMYDLKEKYSAEKGKHRKMWDMIVEKKLTLITKEESINSLVELCESEAFLTEAKEGQTAGTKKKDEDDMMQEIE